MGGDDAYVVVVVPAGELQPGCVGRNLRRKKWRV